MKIHPKLVDGFIMLFLTDLLCFLQIISKHYISPFYMMVVVIVLSPIIDFFINRFLFEKYDSENNDNIIGYIFSIIAFVVCVPLFFYTYRSFF